MDHSGRHLRGIDHALGLALSIATLLTLAAGFWPGSVSATAPGTNGPIAFSSYGKIYTINPDGSGLNPVLLPDAEHKYDFYPSWSPAGRRIVTSGQMREPDGYWTTMGLQAFSPDGSGFAHLPIPGYVNDPAWSPDGAHILFASEFQIFSTTPDGAWPTLVESDAWNPAWSGDGKRISFVRSGDLHLDTELYTMPAEGGLAQKLVDLPGMVMSPSWSPDGSKIVFSFMAREVRENPGPGELPYRYSGPNVYVVSTSGGDPVRLTESGSDLDPVWSPDGTTIAFQSNRLSEPSTTTPGLFLMDADGTNQRPLTTTIFCLQCGADWASLPAQSGPAPRVAPVLDAERRKQRFSRLTVTRTRFSDASGVWVRFRAAIAEKVVFTIRRATPSLASFRCDRRPGACALTVRDERQVRDGLNWIPLRGLLGSAPAEGRYWLRLRSSSDGVNAGVAFRVKGPQRGTKR